jgi:hypothetical protein
MQINVKNALLVIMFTASITTACNTNKVDNLIDKYENILTKWESKAKSQALTEADVMSISQELAEIGIKGEGMPLIENEKVTDAQEKRFEALQERFSKLDDKVAE